MFVVFKKEVIKSFHCRDMDAEQKKKYLTKEVEVPAEMIGELSSDGGVEGIKAMMVADGWDKKEPRAIMCHSIDAAGAIGGSRWLLMVSEYQHIDLKYNK